MEHETLKTPYEVQLALDVVSHNTCIDQLLANDDAWFNTTVHEGRLGMMTNHDIQGLLEEHQSHISNLPLLLEERLTIGQSYFETQFTQNDFDNQCWGVIKSHLEFHPVNHEIPHEIDKITSEPSRNALRIALDLDVWRQLQFDIENYGEHDVRAKQAISLTSTLQVAELMRRRQLVSLFKLMLHVKGADYTDNQRSASYTKHMTDDDYKAKLTPEQYHVLREGGTEAPGSGALLQNSETGDYTCAACGTTVFTSDTKYESDIPGLIGWPSFADAAKLPDGSPAVELKDDDSLYMQRTETICKTCGSHLGHLFPDAGSPTGDHYCINSVALDFAKKDS